MDGYTGFLFFPLVPGLLPGHSYHPVDSARTPSGSTCQSWLILASLVSGTCFNAYCYLNVPPICPALPGYNHLMDLDTLVYFCVLASRYTLQRIILHIAIAAMNLQRKICYKAGILRGVQPFAIAASFIGLTRILKGCRIIDQPFGCFRLCRHIRNVPLDSLQFAIGLPTGSSFAYLTASSGLLRQS